MTLRLAAAAVLLGTATLNTQPLAAQETAPVAEALDPPTIEYLEWHLDNGLQVIAIPDDTTSTVYTSMWYKVGAKLDPEGRAGFAHLFEHILSRKTRNMPYNLIYSLTADNGGTRNASNSMDRTNYHETMPAQFLETMLWTHRERMAFPVVDAEVFENERNVVKEELRTRVFAPPYGRISRLVMPEISYDYMPHRRPSIGSIEDLDAASLDDALAFFEAYYGPDTATLIVAGNFEPERLHTLVNQYFADIPPRARPVSTQVQVRDPLRTSPRSVELHAPNIPLPIVGTVWQLPGTAHPDAAVIDVIEAIMGRGANSRLDEALVRTGLALQIDFPGASNGEVGTYGHIAFVHPEGDLDAVRAVLDAETARLRDEKVSLAELTEAKNEIIAAALRRRETARGRANELGEFLVRSGNPDMADMRLARIAATTPEDIQRVARAYLTLQGRSDVTVRAGEWNPQEFASPVPMPTFRTLPPAERTPFTLLPEGEREAPPPAGAVPQTAVPEMTHHNLSNGIEVIAAQTGDVPIATMTVVLPGGGASDPRAKAGLADFAASLANEGTPTRSAEDIAMRLESLGARFSASAQNDATTFRLTAPTQNFAAAGEVFADILRHARFPEDSLERERSRRIEGLQANMRDPAALARMAIMPLLYGDAPYGNQTSGLPSSLATITREDVQRHREIYWHPATAKLVVTGGMTPEAAFALSEEMFGDWSSAVPAPPAIAGRAGAPLAPRIVVIDAPDMGQAAIYMGARGIARDQDGHAALALANAVLGGGSSGRLFAEIRTERALSYGSYSSIASLAEEPAVIARTQTAHETAAQVTQIMLDTLGSFADAPIDQDWLEKRRMFQLGAYSRARETSSGYSEIIADLLSYGMEAEDAEAYVPRLMAVTPEQANAAAGTVFDPQGVSIVVVGKADVFLEELRALRPDVEVIPLDALDLSRASLRVD